MLKLMIDSLLTPRCSAGTLLGFFLLLGCQGSPHGCQVRRTRITLIKTITINYDLILISGINFQNTIIVRTLHGTSGSIKSDYLYMLKSRFAQ